MAESFTQGVIHIEKLTIFSSNNEVDEFQIREFFREKWDFLSQHLDNGTLLFMAGVHGTEDGKLGQFADSLETMIRQFKIPKMEEIKRDIEKRNIRIEFLGVHEYYTDVSTKQIDEERVINDVRKINPSMVVMVICYSQISSLKFLLEERGLFAEARINRELCIQSKGQILTMTKTQKDLLQLMAKPENIEKKYVRIEGQVGTGKTLMGTEILKMKVAHYMRKFRWTASEGRENMRAIVVLGGRGQSHLLANQLEKELREDLGKLSTFEIHNSSGSIKDILDHIGLGDQNGMQDSSFIQTVVFLDECYTYEIHYDPAKNNVSYHSHSQSAGFLSLPNKGIDCINGIRYRDLGDANRFQNVSENIGIVGDSVNCMLLTHQRSSQQIMTLANYMLRHTKSEFYMKVFLQVQRMETSFNGPIPLWLEVSSDISFVKYAKLCQSTFDKDVMVIIPFGKRDIDFPEIKDLCDLMNWSICDESKINGIESSVVILYDFHQFEYECFTRAKHQLVIVTLLKQRFLKQSNNFTDSLNKIKGNVHNSEECSTYHKIYKKVMKQKPPNCEYQQIRRSRISKLITKNVVIDGVVVPEDAKKESTSFTSKLKSFFRVKNSGVETAYVTPGLLTEIVGSNLQRARKMGRFLRITRPTSLPLEYEASVSGHPSDLSYSSFHNFVLSRQNKE